jgi:hypothetical protein
VTHTPARLLPKRIDPMELEPGDFLRDLGCYRQVESVRPPEDPTRSVSRCYARFADKLGMDLGIPWGVEVTVWREP